MRARSVVSATVIALMLGLAIAQTPKLHQPVFAYHTPDSVDNIIKPTKPVDSKFCLSMTYNPQFITHDDKATTFEFRLFNISTNQTITHVTYLITLTKINDRGVKPSLVELFHSHSGPLVLKINMHNDSSDVQPLVIHGERDPFYNAWVADDSLNPLGIDATREALDAGLYHLQVAIFGIDNDRNVFNQEDMPTFDLTFSLPEALSKQVPFQDGNYNVTVTSYTDRITNFQFDKNTGQFIWSIPYWDVEYLNSTNDSIFVHQEIKVPNSFPGMINSSDSTEGKKVNATINGLPLNIRNFIADPYTFQDYTVFHHVLNKNDMIKMAGQLQNQSSNPAEATFTLASTATVPEFSPAYVLAIAVAVIIVVARKRT